MKAKELRKLVNYFDENYPDIEFVFPLGSEAFACHVNVFVSKSQDDVTDKEHTTCILIPDPNGTVHQIHGFWDKVKEGNYPNRALNL